MFTTIINDCRDDNARARQESRVGSLLQTSVSFIGVQSDLEAGVQLIDILDATEGRPGLILVNVAPRGGHTTKWENGTPFGYFYYHNTLVVSSVDGFALSAVKKLGLINSIELLDTHTAAATMEQAGFISKAAAAHIPLTQFRSFDFIPRAGAYLLQGKELPSVSYDLATTQELPPAIWHIDSFGNCKTTLTKNDIDSTGKIATRYGDFPFVEQLRNLPDHNTALVEGSSGLGETRLLELMTQRANFAGQFNAYIGDDVFQADQSYFSRATN